MSDEKDYPKTQDEIRAALAAIAAKRAARAKEEDEHAAELRELERAQAIDAAEEKHGRVGKGIAVLEVVADGPIVIVHKPANATYRKFQDSKDRAEDACKAFVKPCVVHPSKEEYDAILNEYPGILMRLVKACSRLAGWTDEEK